MVKHLAFMVIYLLLATDVKAESIKTETQSNTAINHDKIKYEKLAEEVTAEANKSQESYREIAKEVADIEAGNKLKYEKLAEEVTTEVNQNKESYRETVKEIEIKVSEYKEAAERVVKEVNESIKNYTPVEVNEEQKVSVVDKWISDYQKILKSDEDTNPNLYIFVSFSMPNSLIEKLDVLARSIGARLVIRGLKNNSFKQTLAYMRTIGASGLGIAVDINPSLFEEYEIKQVPAFVLTDGKKADKITGNVSIKYVLESFKDKGEASSLAAEYLRRFEHGNNN